MAEATAVVALVASIAALIDLSAKIVSRLKDYSTHGADIPKTFTSLADRLPLLTQTLKRIQSRAQASYITVDVAKELNTLAISICEQVKLVEQYLERVIPISGTSRFDRVLIGLKSLAKDEKVKQAVEKIHYGIDVLVLHQTTSTLEVSDHILQELSRLSLQSIPSQQSTQTPTAIPTLGLCLGQAPLIEPDAFIGRRAELKQLHDWLLPAHNAQVQRVEYGHHYSSVFWLNARDELSLRQSLLTLSRVIFSDVITTNTSADDERLQVENVRRWLSEPSNTQWLIIFDNYDDPNLSNICSPTGYDIRSFFPSRMQGSISITTRSPKLTFGKRLMPQKFEDITNGIAVLSQRSGRDLTNDEDARRLAIRLDGLPLALAAAGTYLSQTDASCKDYLEAYEKMWMDLHQTYSEELGEYEDRTLASTWIISFEQVRRQDDDTAELFKFLGYLNNQDIWYELVRGGADWGPAWINRVTTTKLRFDQAMAKLRDYSLINVQPGVYQVHPVLHDWLSSHFQVASDTAMFWTALCGIRKIIPEEFDLNYWITTRRLLENMKRLTTGPFEALWKDQALSGMILGIAHTFGLVFKQWGLWEAAERMYLLALTGTEKVFGQDHIRSLALVNRLGMLYGSQGKLDRAEAMFERALAGYEESFGSEHPTTLHTVNSIGTVYRDQGKMAEAEEMYKRALVGREKAYGPEHNWTLDSANDLGNLHRMQGKLADAEHMCLRALTGRKKLYGYDHTYTLDAVNNLGLVYFKKGRLVEAEEMLLQALAGIEKILGREHPSTLRTVYSLGRLYHGRGQLVQAEEMYARALAGYEIVFGRDDSLTLAKVNQLADLYYDQRQLDKAQDMCGRVLSAHPSSQNNTEQAVAAYWFAAVLNKKVCLQAIDSANVQSQVARLIQHAKEWHMSNGMVLCRLARALFSIRDEENASLALLYFFERVDDTSTHSGYVVCDGCRCKISTVSGWYICRQCEQIDLCDKCMSKYAATVLSLPTCTGHEYYQIGAALPQFLEAGDQTNVDIWLNRLKEKYRV